MGRLFKPNDKVIIQGDRRELSCYDADSALGKKGTITGEYAIDQSGLQDWAKKIPRVTPNTKVYFVEVGIDSFWIFDFHLTLDLDALPYDEWVKARDWNKVYQDQSQKLLRG